MRLYHIISGVISGMGVSDDHQLYNARFVNVNGSSFCGGYDDPKIRLYSSVGLL